MKLDTMSKNLLLLYRIKLMQMNNEISNIEIFISMQLNDEIFTNNLYLLMDIVKSHRSLSENSEVCGSL